MGCDIHSVIQINTFGRWETIRLSVAGDWRNYQTFTVLANVRNQSPGFTPISDPICLFILKDKIKQGLDKFYEKGRKDGMVSALNQIYQVTKKYPNGRFKLINKALEELAKQSHDQQND